MAHIAPEALQQILDARVTGAALHEMLDHLAGCESCQATARAEAQSLDVVLGATPFGTDTSDSNARTALTVGARIGRYQVVGPIEPTDPESPLLGVDSATRQHVALHFIRASFEGVVAMLIHRRFWADVRTLGALGHPNVLRLYEAGAFKDRVYLALELTEGRDVSAWLTEQPRQVQEVLEMYRAAAQGLAVAHHAGAVHGAFGDSSVWVTTGGQVKVRGFALGGRPLGSGFPALLSPEQSRGAAADARSDQYAFCAALKASLERLPAPAPRKVLAALARGLALAPEQRWPSMSELALALEARPKLSRRALALAAGLVTIALAGAWVLWRVLR
jgi:serine/threonine-protein kinase